MIRTQNQIICRGFFVRSGILSIFVAHWFANLHFGERQLKGNQV